MSNFLMTENHATIYTDGGTLCNIPAMGYGEGYGSFQIEGSAIHRLQYGVPMSANAAEITTVAEALAHAARLGYARVTLISDSQIALKWVKCKKEPKPSTSAAFRAAIQRLRQVLSSSAFAQVQTRWVPRAEIFARFGH